jgi:hypothetical protein
MPPPPAPQYFMHLAKAAGSIAATRPAVLPSDTPDHPLGDTNQVSVLLADSINRLRRGQLDPRVANSMGYLTSVLLRSLEQGPIEERLAKIEAALMANAQQGNGGKGCLVHNCWENKTWESELC